MNRIKKIEDIRNKLINNKASIGSWMQIPNSSVAEIMGYSGYDWVAIDLEHGAIGVNQLPDIFRALELGNTLPIVRLTEGTPRDCKMALDAGAGGVIIPMVESAKNLKELIDSCKWPPEGSRGIGFSRANLFGKFFESYALEAQNPFIVAMIENIKAVKNLEAILNVKGIDAIFIGPYDLSSSLGITGQFNHPDYIKTIQNITEQAKQFSIPVGIHVVEPSITDLNLKIKENFQFIAFSIDSVFLIDSSKNPLSE